MGLLQASFGTLSQRGDTLGESYPDEFLGGREGGKEEVRKDRREGGREG
jgi:hypothetical protein